MNVSYRPRLCGGTVRQTSPSISIHLKTIFYEFTKDRHWVRAASRLNLNVLRFESDICELNRLWNEANFRRLCIRLNRSIVRCYGLLNLYISQITTLNCFLKIGFWNVQDTYLHGHAPPHRSLYPLVQIYLATYYNIAIELMKRFWREPSVKLQNTEHSNYKWVKEWVMHLFTRNALILLI